MGDFILANDRRDNTHISQNIFTNCLKANKIIGSINNSTVIINGSTVIINSVNDICLNASNEIKLNTSLITINPQLQHGIQVDEPVSGVHGVSGNIVGTIDSQVLTNKTVDYVLNTLQNIPFTQNAVAASGSSMILPANSTTTAPLGSISSSSPFASISSNSILFNASGFVVIGYNMELSIGQAGADIISVVINPQLDNGGGFSTVSLGTATFRNDFTPGQVPRMSTGNFFPISVQPNYLLRFSVNNMAGAFDANLNRTNVHITFNPSNQ